MDTILTDVVLRFPEHQRQHAECPLDQPGSGRGLVRTGSRTAFSKSPSNIAYATGDDKAQARPASSA